MNETNIDYRVSPTMTNDELNDLFANAWEKHIEEFYRRCGFRYTNAGLIHLKGRADQPAGQKSILK